MIVMVMYRLGPDNKFDLDYYMGKHIPMVRTLWTSFGLKSVQVLKGAPSPTGEAASFAYIAVLAFGSLDEFKAAGRAHGREVMGDVANFTDAQPTLQFNDIVE
jgi:uncharacterized protein (TIGR02118 family)